jgi:membrane associated rhomboid family serine protease
MFPYRDENETIRTPYATFVLIAVNVAVWLLVQGAGSELALARSICNFGLIPGELTLSVPVGTSFRMGERLLCLTDPGRQTSHIFTSMFLHGGWMHILGNMWFMWIFGNNVEDAMGRFRFVVFYLLTGVGAALTQVFITPASAVPMVGASGAISGVMGAYIVLYPRARVFMLIVLGFYVTSMAWPAWMMLGYWLVLQFVSGLMAIDKEGGGVAFWAHFGGFAAGVVGIKLFARSD